MKVGQRVAVYDPALGERQEGTVVEIVGAGDSGAKMLNIDLGNNVVISSIRHNQDSEEGETFWTLLDEQVEVEEQEEVEKQTTLEEEWSLEEEF